MREWHSVFSETKTSATITTISNWCVKYAAVNFTRCVSTFWQSNLRKSVSFTIYRLILTKTFTPPTINCHRRCARPAYDPRPVSVHYRTYRTMSSNGRKRKPEASPETDQPRLRRRGSLPDLNIRLDPTEKPEAKKSFSLPDLINKGFADPNTLAVITPVVVSSLQPGINETVIKAMSAAVTSPCANQGRSYGAYVGGKG